MPWPTPQDYNEAIQNPRSAFADAELRAGHPELNSLGLPRPITGGFASVYKIQCGQRNWAVRCFLRDFPDQQQRYAAISEHLNRVRLPYSVGFTFLSQGIRVRGQWYPILKMEWVQGEPLNIYIEKHLKNPSMLLSLADRWVQMAKALRQASIAHGDLQHGNVFVVQGDFRLVDYDGIYVPALSGQSSHERGHRNYQHPERSELDFGPYLDNFSAWVIYVSLIALSVDPGLWQRIRGGNDQCLLFRQEDFERPETSEALQALERSPDNSVQSLVNLFRSLLYLEPQRIPSLDGQQWQPPKHSGVPQWIEDHLKPDSPQGSAGAPEEPDDRGRPIPEPDPTWIPDFLPPEKIVPLVSFANSAAPERLLAICSVIGWNLLILLTDISIVGAIAIASGMFLLNFIFLVRRYWAEPTVVQRANLQFQLKEIDHQVRGVERSVEAANKEKETLRKHSTAEKAKITNKQKVLEAKEKTEIDASQKTLQSDLAAINQRRRDLNREEADALRKVQNDIGAKVVALNQRIGNLTQAEKDELANALRMQQERHVDAYLRRFSIENASIPGIGPVFKSRLRKAGFQTAADIRNVPWVKGIGPSRAASIFQWRKSLESMARASMPQALSQTETAAIQEKYARQRLALEGERDREQRRQKGEEDAIRSRYRLLREQLDKDENAANTKTKGQIDQIRARYAPQYHSLQETLSKLEAETASKLREIDGRIGEIRKKLFSLHWEKSKLRRELKGYETVRFSNYMKRIFLGFRTA